MIIVKFFFTIYVIRQHVGINDLVNKLQFLVHIPGPGSRRWRGILVTVEGEAAMKSIISVMKAES